MDAAGPAVNAELDIYWASNFGVIDVPAVVSKYKSRIPLLHVKDGSLQKGDAMTAVGSGKLDVAACIKAADPKVLKYLVVELDEYVGGSDRVMDAVRESYQWLVKSGLGVGRK
jgi:sugar phosphate isomerase/epimerase